ncbi:HNH endonuclease signature motif containing protein [Streptomyces capparidis]
MKKRLHKHHFIHRRHGGSDESENLRLVRSGCHRPAPFRRQRPEESRTCGASGLA